MTSKVLRLNNDERELICGLLQAAYARLSHAAPGNAHAIIAKLHNRLVTEDIEPIKIESAKSKYRDRGCKTEPNVSKLLHNQIKVKPGGFGKWAEPTLTTYDPAKTRTAPGLDENLRYGQ
jgi:hypothetical protein